MRTLTDNRVLVTRSARFIRSNLCERLLEVGQDAIRYFRKTLAS